MSIRSLNLHSSSLSGAVAVKHDFQRCTAELRWLAQAILGDPHIAESCIVSGLTLASRSMYVEPKWRDRWIKRCVVREAVDRSRSEIKRIASAYKCKPMSKHSDGGAVDVLELRSLSSTQICETLDAFERAVLILNVYLGFSVHDCALLIDCHWLLIEPACSNALRRLFQEQSGANVSFEEIA